MEKEDIRSLEELTTFAGRFLHRFSSGAVVGLRGELGAGKTTLRFTLDADCRTILDQTLTISYDLGEDIEEPLSSKEHGQRLSKAFAVDLTLNIIERFNPLNPFPSEAQIQALKYQVGRAPSPPLKRKCRSACACSRINFSPP